MGGYGMKFYKDINSEKERTMLKEAFTDDEPVRQKLVEFLKILDKGEAKKEKEAAIYHFFNPLLTDEMLDILVHFKLRKPVYIDDLAEECGLPLDYTAEMIAKIARIGVLEYWPDEHGVDRVFVPQLCVGALEWVMGGDDFEDHPEESVLFKQHVYCSAAGNGIYMPMSNHGVHRAVPVMEGLKNETKKMDWEDLVKIVEKNAHGSYAVVKCICRRSMEAVDAGIGEPSLYWCMPMGHFAEYIIREGKGIRLTKEQFMDRLKAAEDRGFVHNVANANGAGEVEYICNCDYRSCFTMRADLYNSNSSMTRSNFVAQVDPDNCVACGRCVETCPMNAVKMGQRLNPAHGSLYYHYQDTPHEHMKWGEDRHHPNFLNERKDVWQETGTAPCKSHCPAHIAVEGYLRLAALGRYDDALALIKRNNPLPAVCGAICNRRCETACTRGCIDEPIAIDEVKKFLADREIHKENRYIPKKEETWEKGAKVAVIGSGPAGLAAAYYLEVKGDNVTIFEKNEKPGGMLRYGIPSFRLEKDVIDAEIEVITELGAEIKTGVEVGKDVTIQQLRDEGYKAFFVAIGMQGGRKLGVPGEDAEGVVSGVEFMRNAAKNGVGNCSGKVVVVGGGNVAVDVARTAVRSGADNVQMFCLESRDIMPAAEDEVLEAEAEGIKVNNSWGPKEILTKGGKVIGIVFKKCTQVKDPDGRFNPKYDENDAITLEADYVLTSIGQSVVWGDLLAGTNVELRRNQTAVADSLTLQTAEPDIFVGGDVFTGARFAIDAIAAGKEAAESLHRYAWNGNVYIARDHNKYFDIDKENVDYGSYDNAGRQIPGHDQSKRLSFEDDRKVFTEEQVRAETARCLRCGASHVDENMCIGCGVCTTRCEFDAIHLRRVFNCRPVVRENLVPAVLGEVGRRMVWTKTHIHEPKVVKVGTDINPEVSYATGAVYRKPDAKQNDDARAFAREEAREIRCKGYDALKAERTKIQMKKHEAKHHA